MTRKINLWIIVFTLVVNGLKGQSCTLPVCNGNILSDNYSNSMPWTDLSLGTMSISGTMNYNCIATGSASRMYRSLPTPQYRFYAECKLNIYDCNNPQHYIMAFSQTNAEPIDAVGNTSMAVFLNSAPNNPCFFGGCPWNFRIGYNDGSTFNWGPTINISTIAPTYYLRFVRVGTMMYLEVHTSPSFNSQIPGSPIFMNTSICGNVPTNFVQHGKGGTWPWRRALMKVDDLKICGLTSPGCNFTTSCRTMNPGLSQNLSFAEMSSEIQIFPNPSSGTFNIEGLAEGQTNVHLYDLSGRKVKSYLVQSDNYSATINADDLINGIYFVEVVGEDGSWKTKISINK